MAVNAERVFLVGLSGSGKSTVGPLVAQRLGWRFVDSDRLLEEETGCTIEAIFREDGEPAFREMEGELLARLADEVHVVVSTGGGAPTTKAGREVLARVFSVWLVIDPATAAERLTADADAENRPLLGDDPAGRLTQLLEARRSLYQQSDASIDVDSLSPTQAAEEIARIVLEAHRHAREPVAGDPFTDDSRPDVAAVVRAPGGSYPILVRPGLLAEVGRIAREAGLSGRAFVVTDDIVGPLYAETVASSLRVAGYTTAIHSIPSGEQHKTLETVNTLYAYLLDERVERSDFLVCLGGGVTTDLAGFAAATVLRGIPFVHIPTTLLAMSDAAIGGKTGVDHPRGKNMIGAFAQPRAVIIDPALLNTLPERETRAGLAEIVKHGFILDGQLVRDLESGAGAGWQGLLSPELIARSVRIKARVVSEDEREAGLRTLLNYGHTIGHAIEAVTGYERYLHGEAVAIGMHAAGLIARELGMLADDALTRQQNLLEACGLPSTADGVPADAVLAATLGDKKVRDGAVTWVLLERLGHATTRADVPADIVRRAAEAVLR